jgi:hypothetical protein
LPQSARGGPFDQEGTMKKLERTEDQKPGTVTYELDDGRHVTLEESAVQQYGVKQLLEWLDIELPATTEKKEGHS